MCVVSSKVCLDSQTQAAVGARHLPDLRDVSAEPSREDRNKKRLESDKLLHFQVKSPAIIYLYNI